MILVDRTMCLGHVKGQGGANLCIDRDCEVEYHYKHKEEVPEAGAVFLKVPGRKNQVFATPSVPPQNLPEGVSVANLESLVLTVEALRAMMITCINRHLKDYTVSIDDREDLSPCETPLSKDEDLPKCAWFIPEAEPTTLFQATAKRLMTPARMGTTFSKPPSPKASAKMALIDFDSDLESILMGADASAPSEEAESQSSQGKACWSRFADSLTTLACAVVGLEKELNAAVSEIHSSAKVQDQRFGEVERSEQIIASCIGDEPEEFTGSAVW